MKKNILRTGILLAGSLALLAGCSNEDLQGNAAQPDSGTARQVTVTANIGAPRARIAYEEDEYGGLKTTWKTGDKFSVVTPNGNKIAPFTLSGASGKKEGTFIGELTNEYIGGVYCVYPAITAEQLTADGILKLSLEQQQGILNETLPAYMVKSTGYVSGGELNFTFAPQTAIVGITLNNVPEGVTFTKVVLSGKGLCNSVDISIGENPTDPYDPEAVCEIEANGSFTDKVYLAIGESVLTDVKVKAITSENKEYQASLANATLEPGYCYSVTADLAVPTDPSLAWYEQGKESGIFEISNIEQLRRLAQMVNGDPEILPLIGGSRVDFAGKTVKLIGDNKDIDMGTTSWEPIGISEEKCFKGTFDGDGHRLTGDITFVNETEGVFGLFGYVRDGAVIKNVTTAYRIETDQVTLEATLGSIVADAAGAIIENCINTSDITFGEEATLQYLGGIAGKLADNAKVVACRNDGNIGGSNNNVKGGHIGGIAGSVIFGASVVGCAYMGMTVKTTADPESAVGYSAGSICGTSENITACWSDAYQMEDASSDRCGTIVGMLAGGPMTNCYWKKIGSQPGFGKKEGATVTDCDSFTGDQPTVEQIKAMNDAWAAHDSERKYQFNDNGYPVKLQP